MGDASLTEWDAYLKGYPEAHLLQTSAWADLKAAFGWQAGWVISKETELEIGAQILFRPLLAGINMAYIPKGPVYHQHEHVYPPAWEKFWQKVDRYCRRRRAAFLKVEPDIWVKSEPLLDKSPALSQNGLASSLPIQIKADSPPQGFNNVAHTIQPPRTLVIDLRGGEDQILSRMKQKTRYNIKLAQKHGVTTRPSSDVAQFHELMTITGKRDGFSVHSREYFQTAYNLFHPQKLCELFVAEYQGNILAALMAFLYGNRAWYLYGASSNEHRDVMASYLVQWRAMRWAQGMGCTEYDLWGVPDQDLAFLEVNFTNAQDNLWGVYRFKRGFGGELRRSAGPWERVYQPVVYAAYRWRTRKQKDSGLGHT